MYVKNGPNLDLPLSGASVLFHSYMEAACSEAHLQGQSEEDTNCVTTTRNWEADDNGHQRDISREEWQEPIDMTSIC